MAIHQSGCLTKKCSRDLFQFFLKEIKVGCEVIPHAVEIQPSISYFGSTTTHLSHFPRLESSVNPCVTMHRLNVDIEMGSCESNTVVGGCDGYTLLTPE